MSGESSWKATPGAWRRVKEVAREHRKESTPAEAALWDILRNRRSLGLKFRRQHAIGPYIVDFYCSTARLAVEVDGPIHDRQREEDAARTEFLEAQGIRVVRLKNDVVLKSPENVMDYIETVLERASDTTGSRESDSKLPSP